MVDKLQLPENIKNQTQSFYNKDNVRPKKLHFTRPDDIEGKTKLSLEIERLQLNKSDWLDSMIINLLEETSLVDSLDSTKGIEELLELTCPTDDDSLEALIRELFGEDFDWDEQLEITNNQKVPMEPIGIILSRPHSEQKEGASHTPHELKSHNSKEEESKEPQEQQQEIKLNITFTDLLVKEESKVDFLAGIEKAVFENADDIEELSGQTKPLDGREIYTPNLNKQHTISISELVDSLDLSYLDNLESEDILEEELVLEGEIEEELIEAEEYFYSEMEEKVESSILKEAEKEEDTAKSIEKTIVEEENIEKTQAPIIEDDYEEDEELDLGEIETYSVEEDIE